MRTAGGFCGQLHADRGGDAEHPLAADERAAQVVARRLGLLAAEHRRPSPSGSTTSTARMCDGRDAVGQAMRTARVVGDVAADRARLLAARIGGEVQPELLELTREVEVEHAGLDPRLAVHGVDAEDPVHLRRHDHDRAVERHRSAGETGARATRRRTARRGERRSGRTACTSAVLREGTRPTSRLPCSRRRAGTATARSARCERALRIERRPEVVDERAPPPIDRRRSPALEHDHPRRVDRPPVDVELVAGLEPVVERLDPGVAARLRARPRGCASPSVLRGSRRRRGGPDRALERRPT